MIRDGLIALAFDCQDHLPQLIALASRYAIAAQISPIFAPSA
jgi:hypothetical protein